MTATTARPRASAGSDFAGLNRLVNASGLLRRQPAYYAVRMTIVGVLFAAGWAAFFLVVPSMAKCYCPGHGEATA